MRMHNSRMAWTRSVWCTVFVAFTGVLPAQTPGAAGGSAPVSLSVSQAEDIALRNNPRITISRLLALAQGQVTREVRSAELPTVSGNLTAVDSHPGSRITAGALNNPVVYERAAGGVVLSQLITDFGRTPNLVASARLRAQAQQAEQLATAEDVRLAVDQAFYRAQAAQAVVRVAERTVALRQDTSDQVTALANAKLKSTLDQSFAEVNLNQAQLLLLDARNAEAAAFADLSTVLGYEHHREFVLTETNSGPVTPPAPDIEALTALAMRSRPDLAALDDQYQSAERFSRAEHDLWRPTISALGTVGGTPVRADAINSSWYGAAGVNLNIPIFNGFLYSARAREADDRANAAQQQVRDLRNRIGRDVRVAWLNAQSAYERISVTRKLLDQANRALDLAQTRYQLGLSSIVELSQAQLAQTSAQISNTNANYDYRMSLAVLTYQTGQ